MGYVRDTGDMGDARDTGALGDPGDTKGMGTPMNTGDIEATGERDLHRDGLGRGQ